MSRPLSPAAYRQESRIEASVTALQARRIIRELDHELARLIDDLRAANAAESGSAA